MHYNTVLNKGNMGQHTNRKGWEVAMALTTLRALGATGEDKTVLGVGAGIEPTMYHLTQIVGKVVATDLYENAGMWTGTAPADMLSNPAKYAPPEVDADLSRLVVQHADMRSLPFEDESFDGVFSSGSIEHVGSFDDVARAAREIGRVLKPGGIATLSTEFKIAGDGSGWDGVILFDAAALYQHIIEPSGLVLIDEPYLTVHEDTYADPASLEQIVRTRTMPALEMALRSETHDYLFTSVHLALRKPAVEGEIHPDEDKKAAVTPDAAIEERALVEELPTEAAEVAAVPVAPSRRRRGNS